MASLLDLFAGQPPEYMTGLLGEDAMNKLRSQAQTTGLINAAIGYLAQPKNQRLGSALPYLARAFTAGQQGSQGVYEDALKNWQFQQKIDEYNREKATRAEFDKARANLFTTTPAQYQDVVTPGGYAPQQTEVQVGQVAPNYGMTKLPDITQRVMTVPEQQVMNEQALQQMIFSGDPRAATYLSGIKSLKDLSAQPKRETAVVEGNLVDINTGKPIFTATTTPKQTTKIQDYQFYAEQETKAGRVPKSFGEWDVSVESAKAPKSTTTVNLPPTEKAILDVDKETLSGLTANANAARSIAVQTKTINSLIGNQPGSGAIKLTANLQNYLGIKSPEANVNEAITALANKAATEIRTPGSGSTSDMEFNAYRAAFPSLATSQAGRVLMGKIADANAKRMSKLADWARVNVQKGTFSYEGLAAYDDSLGQAVSDDIKKQVESFTGPSAPGGSGWSIKKKG